MDHNDAQITDVLVVLDDKTAQAVNDCIERLKECGLEVVDVNSDEGVIEGSIDAARVHHLKAVTGVCYVRSVFTYTADYPTGDARDQDGKPDTIPERD